MTTVKYIGMNRETGKAITDLDHIRQSIRAILITPVGTRVMRREYGSLLSALIDQPQNDHSACRLCRPVIWRCCAGNHASNSPPLISTRILTAAWLLN